MGRSRFFLFFLSTEEMEETESDKELQDTKMLIKNIQQLNIIENVVKTAVYEKQLLQIPYLQMPYLHFQFCNARSGNALENKTVVS